MNNNENKNNEKIERLIEEIKPHLKEYLEIQGVRFHRGNQFHCFNGSSHKNNDRHASASVTKDGLGFRCFTCGTKGDIFTACNHFEGGGLQGKDFIDTLKYLADMFGINHGLDRDYPLTKKVTKTGNQKQNNSNLNKSNTSSKNPVSKQQKTKNKLIQYVKETEYVYMNIEGQPIYKIVRAVNPEDKKDKQFYPHMFDTKKNKYNKTAGFSKNCQRELYQLPEVKKAINTGEYVFFVEGEKCVGATR